MSLMSDPKLAHQYTVRVSACRIECPLLKTGSSVRVSFSRREYESHSAPAEVKAGGVAQFHDVIPSPEAARAQQHALTSFKVSDAVAGVAPARDSTFWQSPSCLIHFKPEQKTSGSPLMAGEASSSSSGFTRPSRSRTYESSDYHNERSLDDDDDEVDDGRRSAAGESDRSSTRSGVRARQLKSVLFGFQEKMMIITISERILPYATQIDHSQYGDFVPIATAAIDLSHMFRYRGRVLAGPKKSKKQRVAEALGSRHTRVSMTDLMDHHMQSLISQQPTTVFVRHYVLPMKIKAAAGAGSGSSRDVEIDAKLHLSLRFDSGDNRAKSHPVVDFLEHPPPAAAAAAATATASAKKEESRPSTTGTTASSAAAPAAAAATSLLQPPPSRPDASAAVAAVSDPVAAVEILPQTIPVATVVAAAAHAIDNKNDGNSNAKMIADLEACLAKEKSDEVELMQKISELTEQKKALVTQRLFSGGGASSSPTSRGSSPKNDSVCKTPKSAEGDANDENNDNPPPPPVPNRELLCQLDSSVRTLVRTAAVDRTLLLYQAAARQTLQQLQKTTVGSSSDQQQQQQKHLHSSLSNADGQLELVLKTSASRAKLLEQIEGAAVAVLKGSAAGKSGIALAAAQSRAHSRSASQSGDAASAADVVLFGEAPVPTSPSIAPLPLARAGTQPLVSGGGDDDDDG